MMAHQRPPETVFDKPGGAVRAVETMSARAAKGQWRVAPPVEKQQCLFAMRERRRHRGNEAGSNPFSARRGLSAKIDRRDVGQRLRPETGGEPDMAIAALGGIDAALDRRCRRDEDNGRFLDLAAHDGHVAGVVGDPVLLLIGVLVFFIDDERREIREGKKQRRARANNGLDVALCHSVPQPRALPRADAGMPFPRTRPEARREAVEKLRGERDLGHEDQALASGFESGRDGLEINLRLAGAGDPFEQGHRERVGLYAIR